MADTVSPQAVRGLIEQGNTVLLDVRRKADKEASAEMIPGAEWHDPEQVESWKNEIASDTKVVLYCARGGAVSRSVQAALKESGHDAVYIEGGIEAWKQAQAKK